MVQPTSDPGIAELRALLQQSTSEVERLAGEVRSLVDLSPDGIVTTDEKWHGPSPNAS
ncbi:MAG: hypothetical protein ACC660_04360 [Acidimicrobiales bacterium]